MADAEPSEEVPAWKRLREITWEEAVKWANAHGLWKIARMAGSRRMQNRYADSGEGIGGSDINGAAVDLIRGWMVYGTDTLERAGIVTRGIGDRIADVKPIDELSPWLQSDLIDDLACEDKMPTTTGGIAGPTGNAGWANPQPPRRAPKRRIWAPGKPEESPDIVEPAPEPKKRAKQLIVGEKNPFMERLEHYLNQQLGEMEDFQLLNALAGPSKPNDTGVGPRAKGIQQRVEIDNAQRASAPAAKVDTTDSMPEPEEEEAK
jgi:hypothetical protein